MITCVLLSVNAAGIVRICTGDVSVEERDRNYLVSLAVILLIVVGFILIGVKYYKVPKKQEFVNVNNFTLSFSARSDSGVLVNSSYKLLHGNVLKQEGVVPGGSVEQFVSARNDSNYTLSFISPGHYGVTVVCDVRTNCKAVLPRIGVYTVRSMLFEDRGSLVVNVDKGSFDDVKLCLSWGMDLFGVKVKNRNVSGVPNRFEGLVDKCYFVGDLSSGYYVFEFEWEWEESRGVGVPVEFWFVDQCGGGWDEGCGEDYLEVVTIK